MPKQGASDFRVRLLGSQPRPEPEHSSHIKGTNLVRNLAQFNCLTVTLCLCIARLCFALFDFLKFPPCPPSFGEAYWRSSSLPFVSLIITKVLLSLTLNSALSHRIYVAEIQRVFLISSLSFQNLAAPPISRSFSSSHYDSHCSSLFLTLNLKWTFSNGGISR